MLLQLKPAIDAGLLSPKDIDVAINRTLAMRFITGQFDPASLNPWADLPLTTVNGDTSRSLARTVVQKGKYTICNTLLQLQCELPVHGHGGHHLYYI